MPVALLFIVIVSAFSSLALDLTSKTIKRIEEQQQMEYLDAVANFASAAEFFLEKHYRYPNDLAELRGDDNEHLSRWPTDSIGYAVAPFTANGLSYQKVLIWHKRNNHLLLDSSVTENNQVGSTTFTQPGDYQPDANVYWYLSNSLDGLSYLKSISLSNLDETAQRIVYAENILPQTTSSGGTVSVGDAISLAGAVGYTGNFFSCRGVFHFDGAPLTCSDLYTQDGSEVVFMRLSEHRAALYFESNSLIAADGSKLILLTEILTDAS